MFKKRYVIKCSNLLMSDGYVKITLLGSSQEKRINNEDAAYKFATKFRFKFIAQAFCKLVAWISSQNFELRTFSVVEIDKDKINAKLQQNKSLCNICGFETLVVIEDKYNHCELCGYYHEINKPKAS